MIEKKDLKRFIEYYRQLILKHLELINANQQFANDIQKMREILSNFPDAESLVPATDPVLRDGVLTAQKTFSTPSRRVLLTDAHLEKHARHVSHRIESLNTYQHLFAAELTAFEQQEKATEENILQKEQPVPVQAQPLLLSHAIKKMSHHFHQLSKEYEMTAREVEELQYDWSEFYHLVEENMHQMGFEHLHVLKLTHIAKVIEREIVQLIYSWRELNKVAEELIKEYAEEERLALELQKYLEETAQAQARMTISPRPTLFPGGGQKDPTEKTK